MTQANSPTLETVAQRLERIDQTLAGYASHSRRRNAMMAVLSLLVIIGSFFYLGYAYSRYGNEVTPDLVAINAQNVFQGQLPGAREQLETNLKNNAPQYVDKMIDQLQTLPRTYAEQLNQQTAVAMDSAMPQVSEELYAAMKNALNEAKEKKADGTDEQRFQATLAAMGQVYADETVKFVDQAHNTYADQSVEFTTYLNHLASDANLDRREQLHKEMFQNILLLMHEKAKDSGNPDALKLGALAPDKS